VHIGTKKTIRPLEVLAQTTDGESYACHRFCLERYASPDGGGASSTSGFTVLDCGETDARSESRDLGRYVRRLRSREEKPLFRYFLDGSRRTYKVDHIRYRKRVFPVLAAQLGVACCERQCPDSFRAVSSVCRSRLVLAVPRCADPDGRPEEFFAGLCQSINEKCAQRLQGNAIAEIVPYDDSKYEAGLDYENIAVSVLHECMLDMEKQAVCEMAGQRRLLSGGRYLLKDGSLEYAKSKVGQFRDLSLIRNNFRFVVGVSKNFDPELFKDRRGRPNASQLAKLAEGHRTPAFRLRAQRSGGEDGFVHLLAWYVRIRGTRHTVSPFDGILKAELILTGDDPCEKVFESEELDAISANLVAERLPTCYGQDDRWPNHLYPVFLTEKYLKSQFRSDAVLMNLL